MGGLVSIVSFSRLTSHLVNDMETSVVSILIMRRVEAGMLEEDQSPA